jgi:hypothetical protein
MHAMITDVSRQYRPNGRRFTVEQLKDMFMAMYCEETGREVQWLPALHRAGMIAANQSTSRLSVKEAIEFIEMVFAWGAENGIAWSDPKEKAKQQERAA